MRRDDFLDAFSKAAVNYLLKNDDFVVCVAKYLAEYLCYKHYKDFFLEDLTDGKSER